jgi:DNA-directed RNA polymerase specialized sigma24 family protein
MEHDDVYQQLSLRLVNALDKYDYAKCPNMDAYIMLQLRYELLNMKACSKRTGVSGAPKMGFSLLSLDAKDAAGYPAKAPAYSDASSALWLEREIDSLPAEQKSALSRLLSGKRVNGRNKALQAARLRIRERLEFTGLPQYA